jgi:Family of unknown function (DUF6489)
MNITINVDCTPVEAREFLGLPDLRPLQAAWLSEIESRMVTDAKKFSPEALARSWLSGGADWIPNMFTALSRQAQSPEKGDKQSI